MRTLTYFQMNTSDLRTLGVSNAVTTVFAAAGTYLMSLYLDVSKDLQLTPDETQAAAELLRSMGNLAFWAWLFCWAIAICSFLWREAELSRIKAEHGIEPWWKRALARFK